MEQTAFAALQEYAQDPDVMERTVAYVKSNLERFIRQKERVLICYTSREPGGIGEIMEKAVLAAGGNPLRCGPDYRWKTMLRQAFATHASVLIGPPLVVLGLSKAAKATGTPLYIRNVLLSGGFCQRWMIEGIQKGLDCRIWGCFEPGPAGVVGGFSCEQTRGFHLRSEEYAVEIVDENDKPLPEESRGDVLIASVEKPVIRYRTMGSARLDHAPCPCGSSTPVLLDIGPGRDIDPELSELRKYLHSWTSILDCKLKRGTYGLELELVVFRGEKLPELPNCARLIVRSWNPDLDVPFWNTNWLNKPEIPQEND